MQTEIFEGSSPAIRSSLDLFAMPPSDVSVLNSDYNIYFPISNYKDNNNPLQIVINSSNTHHLDLASSFLYLKLRILKSDGSNLTSTDIIAPSEKFFASLFECVVVMINGTAVSRSTGFYPYRHHIQDLLSFGQGVKDSLLTNQLFYPDTTQDIFDTTNKGFIARKNFVNLSTPFEIIGRLADSVFQQNRFFPPNIELKLSLRRSVPEFCLVGAEVKTAPFPFKIAFDEVAFYCKRHLVNPYVAAQHQKLLSSGKRYQYPMRVHEIKSFVVGKDAQTVVSETIFSGNLPEFLVVCFVSSKALLGAVE